MAETLQNFSAPDSERLLVTMATYNERENLPDMVDGVLERVPAATLLIVDDNSPDGTGHWAAVRAANDPRVRLLARPSKLGLGSAIREAMRVAVSEQFTWLVNLDADRSHDPAAIPQLIAATSGPAETRADLAIGSRYVPGGRIEGWPWHRYLMSRGINRYTRSMLGVTIRDCSSGYRCFRTDLLRRLPLEELRASGYAFQEEVLWFVVRAGARIAEVPIVFRDRRYGNSKITAREALNALRVVTQLGWKKSR